MTLQQVGLQMLQRFWNRHFKKAKPKKEKFHLAIADLKSIDRFRLKSVYSSDMSIFRVHSYAKTILEYCVLLEKLINALKYNEVLYPTMLPQVVEEIYIRDFYLDKDRCYIDPVKTTEVFIDLAITFLRACDAKEQEFEKSFLMEKNLMLTQQYAANIVAIAKELSYGGLS